MKRFPQRLLVALAALTMLPRPSPAQEPGRKPVSMEADRIFLRGSQVDACGNVRVRQDDTRMSADRITYNRDSGWLELSGDILLQQPGYEATAPSARLNQDTKLGEIKDPKLHLLDSNAWILGKRLKRYAPRKFRLDDAEYTACSPDNPPWDLHSGTIYVNENTHFAHHWNSRFELWGVPVFYTPYFGHYVDDKRHTGFLYPNIDFSGRRGTDFTIPFYWNIAPQMDATIGLRNMSRYGLMPQLEVRHLGPRVRTRVYGEYLANGKVTGEDRFYYAAQQEGTLPGTVRYNLDAQRVSDPEYLSLFGHSLERGSKRYLTSVLSLSRTWGSYRADANFTYLQDLENFNSPSTLQELPRLTFQGDKPLFPRTPAYLELDGEYVYFYRQQGDRYHRFFADPALSYKFQSRFGTLEPKAGVHYTQYRKVPEGASQGPQNLSRTLPHFSVKADSQVYRIWRSDGWALRHAIEPELYYLYIPYRNQDKLPVLDTKAPPLSFGDLFEMNRFSGIDRINDANQLTMALTNRLDAKWGDQTWEAALLRIGQIRYFRDRRVTLRPGAKPATRGYSNYFADFGLSPIPAVSLKGTLEYDPDRPAFALNQLDYFQSQLTIKHPAGHQLSARYLRRTTFSGGKSVPRTEEYRVSAKVNLGPAWNAFGNYRYSLLFKEPLEQRLGVDYHAGCWGIQLSYLDRLLRRNAPSGKHDTTLYLTFRFRTLGEYQFGTDPNQIRKEIGNL